jgi:hypothetical protein
MAGPRDEREECRMRAFIINAENRPGALADLAEALAERGINITGVAGSAWDDRGAIGVITNDDASTRSVLGDRGADYRELELVAAGMEDKPGTLGMAARRLADRGVNIGAVIPTGMQGTKVTVAFAVDDAAAAQEALGDLALAGSAST